MTARVHLGASPNSLDEVELAVVLGKKQDTVVERNYRFHEPHTLGLEIRLLLQHYFSIGQRHTSNPQAALR